jgi:hypothetical protein
MSLRPRRVASALAAIVASSSSSVLASTFADDGSFAFDEDALVAVGFEPGDVPDAPTGAVESPLQGGEALVLGQFGSVGVTVALPREPMRLRVSVWVRGGETVAALSFYGEDTAMGMDAMAQLFPTGRMTSDGWVELANDIRYDGASSAVTSVSFFAPSGAEVDALEILDAGPLAPEEMGTATDGTNGLGSSCDGAVDGSGCPIGATCLYGTCRDVAGGVPPIPPNRAEVTEYLASRLELIFGPFEHREIDLPVARVALERMRNATDPWTFWNGFLLAVRRLHDGHTSTSSLSDFYFRNQRPIALCFIEGDADLTREAVPSDPAYLDVLVSHAGSDRNLGMRRGDRLVRVDGRHPIAWARSLIEIHALSPTSNHETFAELAEQLRGLVARYAHTLEIVRCDEQGECGDVEVIDLDEDLPLLPDGVDFDGVACDNRPLRHLETSPPNHAAEAGDSVYGGLVLGTAPEEKIYGLEWESLYTSNGSDGVGDALEEWVDTWSDEEAAGVILDHRSGNGGTLAAPAILWDYFVARRESDAYVDRQRGGDERPTLAEGQAIFDAAREHGLVNVVGSESPDGAGVKVALLLTRDVSASDWLPLGLKGSPNARIFAPFETNGAFSTRYMLSYWLGMTYVLASGDTFVPSGETLNGHGVDPDVRVLPLQSDLAQGRDTVFEAALAWLREPAPPPPARATQREVGR